MTEAPERNAMTELAADREAPPAKDAFPELTAPYRRELTAHCYRMTGSVHDAEDLVQETFLRAWKSYESYEGRASLRTWLYRIATNVCLTALEGDKRRPLPTGLGTSSSEAGDPLVSNDEILWLEPAPDAEVLDPADIAAGRSSVRLAFVAALQHLPARQRAVLVLREVLAWSAAEVAEELDMTVAAVNSALQRARERMGSVSLDEGALRDPEDAETKQLLDEYVDAFWAKDITRIVSLLSKDAVWEMPPFVSWYVGAENIGRLVERQCPGGVHEMRMLPTAANGQPAFGLYMRRPDGTFTPFHLQVLTLGETSEGKPVVDHVAAFFDVALFKDFGLPALLAADYGS